MEAWIWVVVPVVAILVWGFTEWLGFRTKQVAMQPSPDGDLEERVDMQQQALEAAMRRIENLEAIVTSDAWEERKLEQPEPRRLRLEDAESRLEDRRTRSVNR